MVFIVYLDLSSNGYCWSYVKLLHIIRPPNTSISKVPWLLPQNPKPPSLLQGYKSELWILYFSWRWLGYVWHDTKQPVNVLAHTNISKPSWTLWILTMLCSNGSSIFFLATMMWMQDDNYSKDDYWIWNPGWCFKHPPTSHWYLDLRNGAWQVRKIPKSATLANNNNKWQRPLAVVRRAMSLTVSGEVAVSVRVDASLQDDGVRHGRKLVEGELLLLTHWRLQHGRDRKE